MKPILETQKNENSNAASSLFNQTMYMATGPSRISIKAGASGTVKAPIKLSGPKASISAISANDTLT